MTSNPEMAKRQLAVTSLAGYELEVGRWLWTLEEVRRRLKRDLSDVSALVLDWLPPHGVNSIGTLLYHIALTEIDWLYEVVQTSRPPAIESMLPWPVRTKEGMLTPVIGTPKNEHIQRLDLTRSHLLEHFRVMDLKEFRRKYVRADYDITPEWVLSHLLDHEARHWGQILTLKSEAKRAGVNTA
jgi:uncharacterized damage-inducible protein DinB